MVFRSNNFVNELGGKLHSAQVRWRYTCQHWETLCWSGLEAFCVHIFHHSITNRRLRLKINHAGVLTRFAVTSVAVSLISTASTAHDRAPQGSYQRRQGVISTAVFTVEISLPATLLTAKRMRCMDLRTNDVETKVSTWFAT